MLLVSRVNPQVRQHHRCRKGAPVNNFSLTNLSAAILVVMATLQSAQALANERTRNYLHVPGHETGLVIDNSVAWADFGEIFSASSSTVNARFFAYRLNTEVMVRQRFVVQAGFLTGVSTTGAGSQAVQSMSHMIVTAGIGYRFLSIPDSTLPSSHLSGGTTAFARYRYIRHITDSNEGLISNGLEIGLSSIYPTRYKSIVADAAVWLTAIDKTLSQGAATLKGNSPQSLGLSLGIGIEINKHVTLLVSEELNRAIPDVFQSRFSIFSLTLRTQF